MCLRRYASLENKDDRSAINQAYFEGRFEDAFAQQFSILLQRVEQLLRAAGAEFVFLRKARSIPELIGAMHKAVQHEVARCGDDFPDGLFAASHLLQALAEVFAHYPKSGKAEEESAHMLLLGFNLGRAVALSDDVANGTFDRTIWNKVLAQHKTETSTKGGNNSGLARRSKAAKTWQPHAKELACEARRLKPSASQDAVVAEIEFGWKLDTPAPGHRTLKPYVSALEKAGELPPRRVRK